MSEARTIDVLLVEDDPDDAELTIRALRKYKLADTLHHAEDGFEALEFLHSTDVPRPPPRVILLDLKLPKINGLEVLRRLRADTRTQHIPVVVLTSSREDRDLKEAYMLGANSYIVKPVNSAKFAEVVGKLGMYWMWMNEPPEDLR
jgi:two-component system response regulator